MLRRSFLALALAFSAAPAMASETLDYAPGLIKQALADGKTVFVDYAADWCSTCARQERVISALREQNPQYDQAMVFVRVDWDDYRRHEVSTSRNIPRRSTLIVLRGDQELGRIVAGTATGAIKALMDQGVSATN
ncbi:MAG: thioredoxin family protein [Alphaproteobacteria bacterium]|nr:thioredoxin family protein [Alphaproteobacteria bacterium]